jgi:hypothetical protein
MQTMKQRSWLFTSTKWSMAAHKSTNATWRHGPARDRERNRNIVGHHLHRFCEAGRLRGCPKPMIAICTPG